MPGAEFSRLGALPLVMTRGWPGSFLESEQAPGPLTGPPAHGGEAAGAFDVVVPSLPDAIASRG